MKRLSFALIGLLFSLSISNPAAAQVISFGGANTPTDGTDGNVRSFSSGTVQVQASGWSFDGNTLEQAYLGRYSNGLGVTNDGEGNGSLNLSHTADNVGQSDFILLVFNQAVNISSAVLTPYNVSSDPDDNDALVSYAMLAGAFTNPATPVALASPVWTTLMANDYNVSGNMTAPYSTSLNSAGRFGNVWIIGAARPNLDNNDDGFKLTSITVTPGVPEPGTWALMLVGFGAIGHSMRRRRKAGPIMQIA